MNNEAKNNFAKLNQSLYFARLQIDAAELLQDKDQTAAFSLQQIQSCNQSAVDHLFRAVYFLSCFVIEQPKFAELLKQNPMQLKSVIESALAAAAEPALQQLYTALCSGGNLSGLLENHHTLWRSSVVSHRSSLNVLASDKVEWVDLCRGWHLAITELSSVAVESKTEY